MDINLKAMGERIKAQRIRKGLSINDLAEKTGMSKTHISNVECGNVGISIENLVSFANSLETTLNMLLCDSLKNAREEHEQYIAMATEDCSEEELDIIRNIVNALKFSLRENAIYKK